jgi:uncharacterized protein
MTTNSGVQYLQECLQIFYWAFFKPNALNQKIKDIHPDLDSDRNPFILKAEFATNVALRRYANQVWLLTVSSPLVLAALVAPLYTLMAHAQFQWWRSLQFIGGWVVGNYIARKNPNSSQRILYSLVVLFVLIIFFIPLVSRYFPGFNDFIVRSAIIVVGKSGILMAAQAYVAVIAGVILGVMAGRLGKARGVALAVTHGLALAVAYGTVGGAGFVMLGVATGVTLSVASLHAVVSVTLGVTLGVTAGVVTGVAAGVSCFLGVLRIYCPNALVKTMHF